MGENWLSLEMEPSLSLLLDSCVFFSLNCWSLALFKIDLILGSSLGSGLSTVAPVFLPLLASYFFCFSPESRISLLNSLMLETVNLDCWHLIRLKSSALGTRKYSRWLFPECPFLCSLQIISSPRIVSLRLSFMDSFRLFLILRFLDISLMWMNFEEFSTLELESYWCCSGFVPRDLSFSCLSLPGDNFQTIC